MPELRQNLATKEWVIIATERARRPEDFKASSAREKPARGARAQCPFCPGNEKKTPPAIGVLGDAKKWRVRVVANKFPALVLGAPQPRIEESLYHRLPGEGLHEVIVDSPSHRLHPALFDQRQMEDLITVYRERFNASLQNPKVALTLLFKNHGAAAGTTLEHPHSQVIGSSVVPAAIRHRMDEAQKYFDQHSACVFCAMVAEERRQKVRIIADTSHFCAFILYAALSPFHLWIVPKRHAASFGEIGAEEACDLAAVLRRVLKKMHVGLKNPNYNLVIQSAPQDRGVTEAFHWYISLMVRLPGIAGFELGSGMYINASIPEKSAEFLNAVKA